MPIKPDDKIGFTVVIIFMALLACAVTFSIANKADKFEKRQRERIIMEKQMSQLYFEGPTNYTTQTQITKRVWKATPHPDHLFQIVELKVSDLENMRAGRVNFIGDTKPTFGTLEELSDVYICQWIRSGEGQQGPSLRPLVGNYHGGFASYHEAVQLCSDVWRQRWRYMKRPQLVRVEMPPGTILQ